MVIAGRPGDRHPGLSGGSVDPDKRTIKLPRVDHDIATAGHGLRSRSAGALVRAACPRPLTQARVRPRPAAQDACLSVLLVNALCVEKPAAAGASGPEPVQDS